MLIHLPANQPHTNHTPPSAGFFNAAGNALNSCTKAMPVYTLTAVMLLTELLLALRENNPDAFKLLLNLGLQELGLDVMDELTRDFLLPLLSEAEADRMMA